MQLPSGIAADIDVTKIFAALQGGTLKSIAVTAFRPAYYIRLSGEETIALKVDGIANLKSTGNATITKAPVEGGTYQSINKVRQPNQLVATVIINGFGLGNINFKFIDEAAAMITNSVVRPTDTLSRIKYMINATQLYDIETPKETFTGYDLVNYSYQVSNSTGVSMLTVQMTFEEVLQVMQVSLSSENANVAGTTTVDNEKKAAARAGLEKIRSSALQNNDKYLGHQLTNVAKSNNLQRDNDFTFFKENLI